jgi:hypothetical protein
MLAAALKPRIAIDGPTTIWIVMDHPKGISYAPYRGERSVEGLTAMIRRMRRAGYSVHVALETSSCAPVAMELDELVALAVLS